jgi:hypothetical protein
MSKFDYLFFETPCIMRRWKTGLSAVRIQIIQWFIFQSYRYFLMHNLSNVNVTMLLLSHACNNAEQYCWQLWRRQVAQYTIFNNTVFINPLNKLILSCRWLLDGRQRKSWKCLWPHWQMFQLAIYSLLRRKNARFQFPN